MEILTLSGAIVSQVGTFIFIFHFEIVSSIQYMMFRLYSWYNSGSEFRQIV